MSIQPLANAQTKTGTRRSASQPSAPGSSFQDQLNAATASKTGTAHTKAAPAAGQSGLSKDELLSALFGLRSTMLDRMKLNKEKKDEKEAWDQLMKYLDAWIESLQEGSADIEKAARAYAALKAAEEDEKTGRKDAGDYLLDLMSSFTV